MSLAGNGCNCFCNMGSGIAKAVKLEFPEAFEADCDTQYGDRAKLGTISSAYITASRRGTSAITVINAYTQYNFRGTEPNVDYPAIRAAFRAIRQQFCGARIGYPEIGAGLARGDWPTIEAIIKEELAGEDHTLIIYKT